MRVTLGHLPLPLVFTLFAVLLVAAPSRQACAQTRAFQMAMWAEDDDEPGVDTDIPVFHAGQAQPPDRRSILVRSVWENVITPEEYNWPLIVAVLVDEPYNDFNGLTTNCWSQENVDAVNARAQALAINAAQLKSVAPRTRFWVNLAKPQLDWMKSPQCSNQSLTPVNVNRSYIDVISVDIYYKSFATNVKPYYDWLETNRAKPDQQLALIPGTHIRSGIDNPAVQASYLPGFFDYANNANLSCDLPLGGRGRTGFFDGCPVWIVLGWLGNNYAEGGVQYIGERDSPSAAIADVWRARVAVPLRPDLAPPRAGEMGPAFLPLLLE